MTEPQRLKDKYAQGLEGALLRSARGDAPSARARGRAFVALGVGSAVAGVPAATTAAAGVAGAKTVVSVGLFAAVKWGSIGLAVGALTVGGIQQAPKLLGGTGTRAVTASAPRSAVTSEDSRDVAPRVEREAPLAPAGDPARLAFAAEPALAFTAEPAPPAPLAPRAKDLRAAEPAEPPRSSPPSSKAPLPLDELTEPRLAEEVAALDRARRLAANDPERALGALDEYDQRFPRGDLAPEALVLRVEALVRAGMRTRAEAVASAYLASHPRSPHAKRIRTIVGWGDDTR